MITGMEELESRICRNILLNDYSQKKFFTTLKDKGIFKDSEIMNQILGITGKLLLEERAILEKLIVTLLLEKEDLKHAELQRLRLLLEEQRAEYIRESKNILEVDERINRFVESLKEKS